MTRKPCSSTTARSRRTSGEDETLRETIRAHEAGRMPRFERALERALELFDLTAADDRWRGPRRREVLRAREEFCRLFFGDPPAGSARGLQEYFLRFATARASRG